MNINFILCYETLRYQKRTAEYRISNVECRRVESLRSGI
ncbi:hypothetical protein D1AOALGA4SA_3835 [Olavius algarvensis Delta 1 endosymbiont]|nr:hypothetical protein D1AOALGA4SA_3835 [Olavius algarvensis Delta 1 endosymbiont]